MSETPGKSIIVSAPSGAGKTTIVHNLLEREQRLAFSVSATSRPRRPHEVNGKDYWRNKARVRHVAFVEPVVEGPSVGRFVVVNRYETDEGQSAPVSEETCRYTFRVDTSGYFVIIQSTFGSAKGDFAFGDQEEMGFGVRLNTPLTVKFGSGRILNSDGGKNENGTWGKKSRWCAYSGNIDGKCVGVALMPAQDNFRSSWFHTRDYGLMVANPFGRKSMTGSEDPAVAPESTLVKKGELFSLGCGVYVFGGKDDTAPDIPQAYATFLNLVGTK